MSAESRPIGDIIAEAREMIAEDDVRLSGMTCYDDMPEDHPYNCLRHLRDNRLALVQALEGSISPKMHSMHYEDGKLEIALECLEGKSLAATLSELREENARLKDENEALRRKSESLYPRDGDERTNRA